MSIKNIVSHGMGFEPIAGARWLITYGFGAFPVGVSDVQVLADFDYDGVFETDLSAYVDRDAEVRIQRGRGRDGQALVSQVQIELDNGTGAFTPEYESGTFYGKLGVDVPIRIVITFYGTDYILWTGYSKEWSLQGRGVGSQRRCVLTAQDILGAYLKVSKPIYVNVSTSRDVDGALVAIMDALGLTASDRDFDDALQDLPYHFVHAQDASAAFEEAVASEMGGEWYVTKAGKIRFENRAARLGIATVDGTWGDGTSIEPEDVEYELNDDQVASQVDVIGSVFTTAESGIEVLRFPQGMLTRPVADSIQLVANVPFTGVYPLHSPATAIVTPVANVDYLANDAANGSSTDRTGNVTVTVTNLGTALEYSIVSTVTCYLTFFRVRGDPVAMQSVSQRATAALSTPTQRADRGITVRVPFVAASNPLMRDLAVSELRKRRWPFPVLRVSFSWGRVEGTMLDATTQAMVNLELGDLIALDDTDAGLWGSNVNEWWRVVALEHRLRYGNVCQSVVTLWPSTQWRDLDNIVYDTFNRANATGDLGTSSCGVAWANDQNFDIVSNVARANSDVLQMPNLDVGAADHVVEASLASISGDADAEVGVVFRYVDANNQYRFYVDKGSSEAILEKNVSGVVTELSSPAWTAAATAELRAFVQGSRIRCYIGPKKVVDTTDSALASGTRVGLFARNASGTVTFDSVYGQGL